MAAIVIRRAIYRERRQPFAKALAFRTRHGRTVVNLLPQSSRTTLRSGSVISGPSDSPSYWRTRRTLYSIHAGDRVTSQS
jgi:hypothetical protein